MRVLLSEILEHLLLTIRALLRSEDIGLVGYRATRIQQGGEGEIGGCVEGVECVDELVVALEGHVAGGAAVEGCFVCLASCWGGRVAAGVIEAID